MRIGGGRSRIRNRLRFFGLDLTRHLINTAGTEPIARRDLRQWRIETEGVKSEVATIAQEQHVRSMRAVAEDADLILVVVGAILETKLLVALFGGVQLFGECQILDLMPIQSQTRLIRQLLDWQGQCL